MFGERKVLELAAGSKELDFIESKILILKVLKENTSLEKIKNIFKESYRLQKFLNDCEMYVANPSLLEEVLAELEQTKTDLYNHFFKRRSTIKYIIARKPRYDLNDQLLTAQKRNISVVFNHGRCQLDTDFEQLIPRALLVNDGKTILETIVSDYFIQKVDSADPNSFTPYEIYLNRAELNRLGESEYQTKFNKIMEKNQSNNNQQQSSLPVFLSTFDVKGKVDSLCTSFPMALEFKKADPVKKDEKSPTIPVTNSDFSVLQQSLDRILTMSNANGLLSRIVVLAVTGTRSFVLCYRRELNRSMKLRETITINKVSEDCVRYIWKSLAYLGSIATEAERQMLYLIPDPLPLSHPIESFVSDEDEDDEYEDEAISSRPRKKQRTSKRVTFNLSKQDETSLLSSSSTATSTTTTVENSTGSFKSLIEQEQEF